MKAQMRTGASEREQELAWQAADAEITAHIGSLFDRCPELGGFSVQAKVFADAANRPEDEELFVTAISIAPRLSKEQYATIFEQISASLMQLLGERPEAKSLLRGRTFARVFH